VFIAGARGAQSGANADLDAGDRDADVPVA